MGVRLVDDESLLMNAPTGLGIGREVPEPETRKPTMLELVGAAWRQENTLGSFLNRQQNLPGLWQRPTRTFDPFPHIPTTKQFFADRYVNANSLEEVQAINRQIDREETDRAALASGGLLGVAANLGVGLLDPINLIPIGGAAWKTYRVGGSILKGALLTAAAGAGAMSLTEAALHASQYTRTPEESAFNIASGTFLSGILGGGASVWARSVEARTGRLLDDLAGDVEKDLTVPRTGRYTRQDVLQALEEYGAAETRVKGIAAESADFEESMSLYEAKKARYERMIEDVHEADPLEPGAVEVPEAVLKADVGDVDPALERSFTDYLQVGVKPPRTAVAAPESLDDLEKMLSEIAQTRVGEAGELTAFDFLSKLDVPIKSSKKVGDGTGFSLFVPGRGTVHFKRGDTLTSLIERLGTKKKADGARRLASFVKKSGGTQAIADEYNAVLNTLKDDYLQEGDATTILGHAENQASRLLASMEEQELGFLVEVNQRANDALDRLSRVRSLQEYDDVINSLEDPDFDILPEAFWDDFGRVNDAVTRRLENPADSAGTANRQQPAEANDAGRSADENEPPPGGNEPPGGGSAGGGNNGPVDPPTPENSATLNHVGNELIKDEALIKRLPLIAQQDPLMRLMLSGSLAARKAVQVLVENPLKYAKNTLGVATTLPVEAMIKQTKAPLAFALKHLDDQFIKYRLGRAAKLGDKARLDLGDLVGATPTQKLTAQQFREEVAKAMRRGDVHDIPEVASAARKLRQDVFEPLKNRAIGVGALPEDVDPGTALSYLTRVWDVDKIRANYDDFFQANVAWLKHKNSLRPDWDQKTDAQLEDIAEQIIDRITGLPDGRLSYDLLDDINDELAEFLEAKQAGDVARMDELIEKRNAQRADFAQAQQDGLIPGRQGKGGAASGVIAKPMIKRVYDIPDALIEQYLVNDVEVLSKIYERTMSADVSLMEAFGTPDLDVALDGLKQGIRREWAEKIRAASTPHQARKLAAQRDSDLRDIAALWHRLRGTYGLPADPASAWVRGGKVLRTLNFMSLMGNVVLSSLADVARPMMVHGLRRYLTDGLVPLVTNFKAVQVSAKETQLAGTALDLLLQGRMMNIGELMDDFGRGTKFERTLAGMADGFGRMTGISHWNSFMKQWAGMMTQSRIIDAVQAVRDGSVSRKELSNLAASYIDPRMAKRIAAQFDAHGMVEGSVKLPNTSRWEDREAARVFRAALARDVDKIIVTPGVGDKPLWLSTEWGKLLGQFKSFFISATQRVLLSGLQERDLAVLNGMVFATGMGVVSALVSSKVANRDISMAPDDLILEGVDRSGATGWLLEMNNVAEKLTRGKWGLSAMMGKQPMSRYASRNVIDSIVGPSAGRVEDLARMTGAAATGEWQQSDVRAIRRLIPFQNLFYLRGLFDAAEQGLTNSLGLPVSE